MGDYAKAEPLFKEALEIRQKVLGPEHPDTATSLNNLAALYQAMGDYAKAEPLFKEALEIRQKVLGPRASRYGNKPEQSGACFIGRWATMPKPNRCSKKLWRFAKRFLAASIPIRRQA